MASSLIFAIFMELQDSEYKHCRLPYYIMSRTPSCIVVVSCVFFMQYLSCFSVLHSSDTDQQTHHPITSILPSNVLHSFLRLGRCLQRSITQPSRPVSIGEASK